MRFLPRFAFLALATLGFISLAIAQDKATFPRFGLSGSLVLPSTEFYESQGLKNSYKARGFFQFYLSKNWELDAGGGFILMSGLDYDHSYYRTNMYPADLRIHYTFLRLPGMNTSIYAGGGAYYYRVVIPPRTQSPEWVKREGIAGYVPFGLRLDFPVSRLVSFDITGGFSYGFTDNMNHYQALNDNLGKRDGWGNIGAGLSIALSNPYADDDNDGLTNPEEEKLGTNPDNPDTDGDGLMDGEEVKKYHTDPLKTDTDGDGLTDGEEVQKYHTDPLKMDTDGDGLSDGDEVLKYHTDPLNADTDGDGLSDGDEVAKHHTDPLNKDTDGDGLTDGEEVLKYHTNPMNKDTDEGTIDDGTEVRRGTDPLNPADDLPPAPKVNVPMILQGIEFDYGKSDIKPVSDSTLEKALNTLKAYPDILVEIDGHTDNKGGHKTNMKLSERRADAVKAWLVTRGIDPSRITTKGYGPDKPIDTNKTAEGRQKNRRIEFLRTK